MSVLVACGDDDDDNDAAEDDDNDQSPADDDDESPECPDEDGDGYIDAACGGDDCNDADETIFPGAEEICDDGIDQDCDETPDDGCYAWEVETIVDAQYTCMDSVWGPTRCHSAAFSPDDLPVVAFRDPVEGVLKVAMKSAKGKEWIIETVDADGDTGATPSIDVDSTGRIAVAYYNYDTNEIKVAFKPAGGAWVIDSLGPHGGLADSGGWPTLHFNGDDKAHVTTFRFLSGNIVYWQETTQGEWDDFTVFPAGTFEKSPDFDFNSQGLVGMAWQDDENDYTVRATYFGTYDLVETAQQTTVNQSAADAITGNATIAFDGADVPHVFYARYIGQTQLVMAAWNGSLWDMSEVPDDNTQLNGPFEARHTSDGAIWLSYASDYPLSPRLAKYDGETWTFFEAMNNDEDQYGKRPALALDSQDMPGVACMFEPDFENGKLLFAHMTGTPEVP
jgi:hypothetical protein